MRAADSEIVPAAANRARNERVRFWAGMVLAASGLVAVFLMQEVYVGFAVALVGTGLVPFDRMANTLFKR